MVQHWILKSLFLQYVGKWSVYVVSDPVLGQQAAAELLKPVLSESTHSPTEYFSEEALFSSSLEHTGTHTNTQIYINTIWDDLYQPLSPQKHTEHSEMWTMMHAELTDRAHSKTKDGGVEMGNCEQYVGKASKCTANGESFGCLATILRLLCSYRASK